MPDNKALATGQIKKNNFLLIGKPSAPHVARMLFSLGLIIANSTAWFDMERLPTLIASVVAIAIVAWTINRHKRGRAFQMREIAGLSALDNAVGRATEMARPVLYTPGWGGDIQRPTTIASMNVLSHVAARTARYNCDLIYPTHDPVIMAVAQEVVREAYADAGYLDRFKRDNITYVTSSQFGYAAAVDGMISRARPASIFLLGTFEAESLILAETGNSIGAIQIAGTDSTIQLAFFIVACDYTLIGEELFAASGYLSQDESILASVQAQDIMKVVIAVFLVVATIAATLTTAGALDLGQWWSF